MTHQQKALVRYWLVVAVLLIVFFALMSQEHFRLFALLLLVVGYLADRTIKPVRPEGVPTPLEVMKSSSTWKWFFVVYAFGGASLVGLAVSVDGLGSWLSDNPWIIFPLVLLPMVGPLIQDQVAQYRAYE